MKLYNKSARILLIVMILLFILWSAVKVIYSKDNPTIVSSGDRVQIEGYFFSPDDLGKMAYIEGYYAHLVDIDDGVSTFDILKNPELHNYSRVVSNIFYTDDQIIDKLVIRTVPNEGEDECLPGPCWPIWYLPYHSYLPSVIK